MIAAYQWWREAGRPATEDWLVTIDQHIDRSPTLEQLPRAEHSMIIRT